MAIRKKKAEGMTSNWMTSYGDMVTLLLCFFILLYAMATIDAAKFERVSESMKKALGIQVEGLEEKPMLDMVEEEMTDEEEREQMERDMQQLQQLKREVDNLIQEAELEDMVHTEIDDRGLLIRMSTDDLLFDLGLADIKPGAVEFLNSVSIILAQVANEVIVEGHTDNLPIMPGYIYPTNWELSTARACAVVRHILAVGQMEPHRLQANGFADSRPRVPNDTPQNRGLNRRVELMVRPMGRTITEGFSAEIPGVPTGENPYLGDGPWWEASGQ